MNFWLKFGLSALVLLATPTLAIFSGIYDRVARKVGAIMPQHIWFTITVSLIVALFVLAFYSRQYWLSCHKSFKAFLRPVKGKGYCIDTRYDEPVCPKCAANGAETFLRVSTSMNPDFNDILFCGVCHFSIEIESCWIKEHGSEAVK